MSAEDILEEIASLKHDQWMDFAKDLIESEDLSEERVTRWKSLMVPYSELSEENKEKDRVHAKKVMSLFGYSYE